VSTDPGSTADSQRLRAVARRVADVLVEATHPVAVLLAGSAGEGIADARSDIDLGVYYERVPGQSILREAMLSGAGAVYRTTIGQGAPDGSFRDVYELNGIDVDLLATTAGSVDRQIDRVLTAKDPGEPLTMIMAGLRGGLPLLGDDLIAHWRARVSDYPDELALVAIRRNLDITPYWATQAELRERDALLFEIQALVEAAFQVLAVLSALNRVHFTRHRFKRLRRHVDGLAVSPPRLAERLESLFAGDRVDAAGELRRLVEETVALVEERMPEVDTAEIRRRLAR